MIKRVKTITEENFSDAVDYAYVLNKKMHFNVLSEKIVLPFGSILLTLYTTTLFLVSIYLMAQNNPERLTAFNALPFVPEFWDGIWGTLGNITDLLYVKIIIIIASLIIVPFIFSSIVALIVFCLTKPNKPEAEESTAKEAKKLYHYLNDAPQTYYAVLEGAPVLWRRICGIVSGIGCMVFSLYFYGSFMNQTNDFGAAVSALLQSDKNTEEIVICLFMGVGYYFIYAVLHIVLSCMLQPYCDSHRECKKFTDEAEKYWLSIDKEEREKREKEASREHYDGWKYKNLEKTQYYKDKSEEYYANYMGLSYETDEDKAKRLVRDVEDDLSGGGWGNY